MCNFKCLGVPNYLYLIKGGEYAVVDKNYRAAEEDSPYEVIWAGSKPKQNISKVCRVST